MKNQTAYCVISRRELLAALKIMDADRPIQVMSMSDTVVLSGRATQNKYISTAGPKPDDVQFTMSDIRCLQIFNNPGDPTKR